MRIATYNIEWFNALFADDGSLHNDGDWSARWNVTRAQQTQSLARVFQALDADAIMIVEAPDASRRRDSVFALEGFARHAGIRARRALTGFENDTQQEIALLYDPDIVAVQHAPLESADAPRFDQSLLIDLDIDAKADEVTFSKPPLEVALQAKATGALWRMIGVHVKSKAPHGARDAAEALQRQVANRRKQLAQCIWIRRRVDHLVTMGEDVIVLGDFNDGPGLDKFEALFGRSGVEIVLGQGTGALFDPHAAMVLGQRIGVQPTTSRFYLREQERYFQALLDYIMVSDGIRQRGAKWRIMHPLDDPACWQDKTLSDALLTASDHFPVLLDVAL
ncbi:endonuclease/exonuclease/phosphatase family protein [Nereida sp. MMG025]|uniref:endonuclease/exonuclease/phosphatase family protein n=1 Tax=Nereida sp. MMG025 TaxID=2909981 RepID=UPI001F46E451|nr:endonuclease/exonuclease/phosphatase family protein [Nereida sp. MMG025]MCF6443908.1 endonuclease/exonuclease/phosphatase family protein [Nereida sp. MMG025]